MTLFSQKKWFVMRDLKRRNSKVIAVHCLSEAGFEVFTPMTQKVMVIGGCRQRKEVPVIQDLLFVHDFKANLDPFVDKCSHLQYRFVRGKREPMTVREEDMKRFIHAVGCTVSTIYYKPDELVPFMCGKKVRIVGGLLNGYEGKLLSVKGMRKRRLIVEIPFVVTAAVEVEPDFIEFI